jgi:hypothetical protein
MFQYFFSEMADRLLLFYSYCFFRLKLIPYWKGWEKEAGRKLAGQRNTQVEKFWEKRETIWQYNYL